MALTCYLGAPASHLKVFPLPPYTLASSPSDDLLWVLPQSTQFQGHAHCHGAPCSGLWGNGPMRGCYTLAVTGRNFCQQNEGLSMSSSISSPPMLSYTSSFLQTLPLSLWFRYSSWAVSVVASWALRCLVCILAWVLRLFIHFLFLVFWDMSSDVALAVLELWRSSWPSTHKDLPAAASRVLSPLGL